MNLRQNLCRWWVRAALLVLIAAVCTMSVPACFLFHTWWNDRPVLEELPPGYADDASRMNRTAVAEVWAIPTDEQAAEVQLRELLLKARTARLGVAIAGARHSMGGHTIAADGIVINMLPFNGMKIDTEKTILHVGAGARWSEIVPFLDTQGLSVAVMQSNNNFSVGGSISVNCHGWQHNQPPIASTVESLRLMKADGAVVRCSRAENAELFSLVLGGYGLFGVILEVDLRVVPNERYKPDVEVLPCDQYAARFAEKVNGAADIGMVYGRLCVVPGEKTFLHNAIMTVFRKAPCQPAEIPALKSAGYGAHCAEKSTVLRLTAKSAKRCAGGLKKRSGSK